MAKVCVRGVSVLLKSNHFLLEETPKDLTMDFDDVDEEDIVIKYKKVSGK